MISKLEVLGFHNLQQNDKEILEHFFKTAKILSISDEIIEQAIQLRQTKKMSIGDAIIAATALEYNLTLVTANTKDFSWITALKVINPLHH